MISSLLVLGYAASAINNRAVSQQEQSQVREQQEQQREAQREHDRRLAWNLAHPAEAARIRAAQRVAIAQAARAYAAEHPSDEVIATRFKAAVAEFDSQYPNNSFVLQIRQETDDLSKAVIVLDKAQWRGESSGLQSAQLAAFSQQWDGIYRKHGLPGDPEAHLGYVFTDMFDSK